MKKSFVVLFFISFCLLSCVQKAPYMDPVVLREATSEDGLRFDQYNKSQIGAWPQGKPLSRTDARRVRRDEHVATYYVGRRPSRDRKRMHEAHRVYDIRQSNRWDRRIPARQYDSLGSVIGVEELAYNPAPSSSLLKLEEERQKNLTKSLELNAAAIAEARENLQRKINSLTSSKDLINNLGKKLQNEINKRKEIEQQLSSIKRKISKARLEAKKAREKELREKKERQEMGEFEQMLKSGKKNEKNLN